MSLTYWDLDLIHERMKYYDIKYVEVYDEIFDHITSAIEEKQNAGDSRKLSVIFDDVVAAHFGGYEGIEKLAKNQESDYRRKIRKRIRANFLYYVNFKSLAFTFLLMLLALMLPAGKITFAVMGSLLLITAFFPSVYVYFKLRRIMPSGDKKSLIYRHTVNRANLPGMLLYCALWLPQLPYIIQDKELPYKIYNLPPVLLAFVLSLMLIYSFSCARLCKQELEQFAVAQN